MTFAPKPCTVLGCFKPEGALDCENKDCPKSIYRDFIKIGETLKQSQLDLEQANDKIKAMGIVRDNRLSQLVQDNKQKNYFEQSHLTALQEINGLHSELLQANKDKQELAKALDEAADKILNLYNGGKRGRQETHDKYKALAEKHLKQQLKG